MHYIYSREESNYGSVYINNTISFLFIVNLNSKFDVGIGAIRAEHFFQVNVLLD